MFNPSETSPLFQLKKHYLKIYEKVISREINECNSFFTQNIEKGIQKGLYRKDINIPSCVKFYYTLIFSIKESTIFEKESLELEYQALEYHTRAMATPHGIEELEKIRPKKSS